jgi:hypothetical protein
MSHHLSAPPSGDAGIIGEDESVTLVQRQLEVYSRPTNGIYTSSTIFKKTDLVDMILDDQIVAQIRVSDLLPRR